MSDKDTVYRQAAIDALHGYFDGMLETDTVCPSDIYGLFECIPSAQPEKRTEERAETHACDLIDRQAAIEAIRASTSKYTGFMEMEMYTDDDAVEAIESLPSAQPDIILCPNCRYNDGTAYCELHYRDVKAKDFCSWAERR